MANGKEHKPYYCMNRLLLERLRIDIIMGNKSKAELAREYYISHQAVSYHWRKYRGKY